MVVNDPHSHCRRCYCWPRVHEATGAADLALDSYRNALAVSPPTSRPCSKVAGLLVAKGEFEPAERLLQGYLAENPTNTEARRLLAESYSRQQRWDDALAVAATLESEEASNTLGGTYLKGRVLFAQRTTPVRWRRLPR